MIRTAAVALMLFTAAQSPTAMAAVVMFATNVDRKWPADEREPFVTVEALRLMEAAAVAIAEDAKANTGKVKEAIDEAAAARTALEQRVADEDERPRLTRDALLKGHAMIESLAGGVRRTNATTRERLSGLKRSAEAIDRKRNLREQGETLERYFGAAAELLRGMLDAQT